MRRMGFVVTIILITALIVFWLESYYTHDNDDLPAGVAQIDDIYVGYKLTVPGFWYGIPGSATNRDIIGFFLDVRKFHHIRNARLPIRLDILKEGGEFRIFFIDFNEESVSNDFASMGTILVVRDVGNVDFDLVKSKIEKLEIEIYNLQSVDKKSLNKNLVFHTAGGNVSTRDGMAYLSVTYFETDIGLVIIPIISPLDQNIQIQFTMDEIIKSIEVFEPQEVPIPGE